MENQQKLAKYLKSFYGFVSLAYRHINENLYGSAKDRFIAAKDLNKEMESLGMLDNENVRKSVLGQLELEVNQNDSE